jgi:hypothetical protein
MRHVYRRLFVRFLKEEEVYHPFRRNFAKMPMQGYKSLGRYLRNVKKEDAMRNAFSWRNTQEGLDFWADVACGWRSCLENNGLIQRLFRKYWRLWATKG